MIASTSSIPRYLTVKCFLRTVLPCLLMETRRLREGWEFDDGGVDNRPPRLVRLSAMYPGFGPLIEVIKALEENEQET